MPPHPTPLEPEERNTKLCPTLRCSSVQDVSSPIQLTHDNKRSLCFRKHTTHRPKSPGTKEKQCKNRNPVRVGEAEGQTKPVPQPHDGQTHLEQYGICPSSSRLEAYCMKNSPQKESMENFPQKTKEQFLSFGGKDIYPIPQASENQQRIPKR